MLKVWYERHNANHINNFDIFKPGEHVSKKWYEISDNTGVKISDARLGQISSNLTKAVIKSNVGKRTRSQTSPIPHSTEKNAKAQKCMV